MITRDFQQRAALGMDDALGRARGARRKQDVERMIEGELPEVDRAGLKHASKQRLHCIIQPQVVKKKTRSPALMLQWSRCSEACFSSAPPWE